MLGYRAWTATVSSSGLNTLAVISTLTDANEMCNVLIGFNFTELEEMTIFPLRFQEIKRFSLGTGIDLHVELVEIETCRNM